MREAPGDIVAQIEAEYRARKHARNSEVERLFAGVGNGTSSDCGCHQTGSIPDRVLAVGRPGPRRFGGPPAHIVGLMGRKNRLARAGGGGPINVSSVPFATLEYDLHEVPEEPCPKRKIVQGAIDWSVTAGEPFPCRKTFVLGSGKQEVKESPIVPGYLGANVWSQAPAGLSSYFSGHTFDSPGAIWTYIKGGAIPTVRWLCDAMFAQSVGGCQALRGGSLFCERLCSLCGL
jgi:hypothetical protein